MSLETCIAHVMRRRWLTILLSVLVMLALAAGARNRRLDQQLRYESDEIR